MGEPEAGLERPWSRNLRVLVEAKVARQFCRERARVNRFKTRRRNWCPGWESNSSGGLILRKLLILRNSQTAKNPKNAEARYTEGTRESRCGGLNYSPQENRRVCETNGNSKLEGTKIGYGKPCESDRQGIAEHHNAVWPPCWGLIEGGRDFEKGGLSRF